MERPIFETYPQLCATDALSIHGNNRTVKFIKLEEALRTITIPLCNIIQIKRLATGHQQIRMYRRIETEGISQYTENTILLHDSSQSG